MRSKTAVGSRRLTESLDAVAVQFARWRSTRGRGRIPKALWQQAIAQAQVHGVKRTAEVLRLNTDRLSGLMPSDRKSVQAIASPLFVDLTPVPISPYTVEFSRPEGARMRVELPNAQPEALVALAKAFLVHTE